MAFQSLILGRKQCHSFSCPFSKPTQPAGYGAIDRSFDLKRIISGNISSLSNDAPPERSVLLRIKLTRSKSIAISLIHLLTKIDEFKGIK